MTIDHADLPVEELRKPDAYPHPVGSEVLLIETHISWVLLAGEFAYKIKKPIHNNFIDYSSLALRKHYCEEELRLNQRFAKDVYLDVVAITNSHGHIRMADGGEPIEYAVRMRRFAADALLNYRVAHNLVDIHAVRSLAANIATFHSQALIAEPASSFGTPELIREEAIANYQDIAHANIVRTREMVELLEHWSAQCFERHQCHFQDRKREGHVRECHGDLHLGNVVLWKQQLLPFDGIEFCDEFRWIDTLSDAAFAAMDFAAHGRLDFCHSFVNAYLEFTGDYSATGLLQWYLVYRAMVRAKVAALRSMQTDPATPEHVAAERELDAMLELANRFTQLHTSQPKLWITYGLSGSGKTTGSEQVLQRHGAVRIRADVERKRIAGLNPLDRVVRGDEASERLYSSEMTTATYARLAELAEQLLKSNVNVIIDATCLLKQQREIFRELAVRKHVPFGILAFHADPITLRNRIFKRQSEQDASDADCEVLEIQLQMQQHLEADELPFVSSLTD
ncbi:MAG: AAA family ATPase [Pirellulaceae bacterium]|nr:AAA family ATPase [Pirellulaceae bacterium]